MGNYGDNILILIDHCYCFSSYYAFNCMISKQQVLRNDQLMNDINCNLPERKWFTVNFTVGYSIVINHEISKLNSLKNWKMDVVFYCINKITEFFFVSLNQLGKGSA